MTTDRGHGLYSNGIHACRFHTALSGGALFYGGEAGATTLDASGSTFNGPGSSSHGPDSLSRGAVHLDNATECSFVSCVFETPDASTAISMRSSGSHGFINCHFEPEAGSAAFPLKRQWIITTSGFMQACTFQNCYVLRHQATCGPRILQTSAAGAILPFRFKDSYWLSNESASGTDDFDFGSPRDAVLLENVTLTAPSGRSVLVRSTARGRYGFSPGDGGTDAHHAAAGSVKVVANP
jgi:hypothetical protein